MVLRSFWGVVRRLAWLRWTVWGNRNSLSDYIYICTCIFHACFSHSPVDRHLGSFFIWDYYEWYCYEHMCKIFCLNTFSSFLVKISVLKWLSHIKSVHFKEAVTIFCNMSVQFGFLLATHDSYICFLLLLEIAW